MIESLIALGRMIAGMTPFLLFGFLCAGILHVVVPQTFYRNCFSENSFRSVLLAALFGIPLPLCSCGVLPTAMSLRKEGASKGATTAFLTATPQTGVDSILATYSVFGLPFAIIRPIAALITSLFSGGLVTALDNDNTEPSQIEVEDCDCHSSPAGNKFVEIFRYGFVNMLQDIGSRLVIGMVVAGLIAVFVPDSFLLQFSNRPLLEMLVVIVIALPMYVCATGSIPIAAALMLKGLTPGAALVFLMAGPAVSFASLMVVQKVMGLKTMLIYVLSIIVGSIAFGLFIDLSAPAEWFSVIHNSADCCETHFSIIDIISTIIFVLLIINSLILKKHHVHHQYEHHSKTYKVEGMRCNHCKMSVETNLQKLSGVKNVIADPSASTVVLEGEVGDNEVQSVVESLGFIYGGNISE